ncbi:sigma 54-interacting transcriptional regulator [Erwinia sp. INIA-01]|uniref:sigma-54 interaction domain-containing protein n=1 Tax=Erwinia sp. INIA01 TaxID=2991500 RepID=UPI002224E1EE|nr:sigma 54-interacting transcriptional regulator [Erwinia sp. INIA01]MCW1876281.1 sigma 54-interacting transcriptional regulator [Erwinia sp. INIA01]
MESQKELVRMVSLFSRFFDLIHQPITIIDRQAKFIYYNQESAGIDGYSVQSALGKSVQDVYGLCKEKSTMLQALYDGKEFIGNYQIYYNRKGKAVEFQHTTVPLYNSSGEIQGVIEIGRDISSTRILQDQVVELNSLLYNHNQSEKKYEIITADPRMQKLIDQAKRLAIGDVPVMIVGETGTGKELFARLIHHYSNRADKPFIALNCGAIPEALIESTLFGTEKGAFTGAEHRQGYLELAQGGTLFLDELNSMPVGLQSKLLRFCQDKTFWKVGGSRQQTSDIRILSAVNEPPSELLNSGHLRSDLYYRLCVGQLVLPPLSERPADIRLLSNYFIEKYNNIVSCQITHISEEVTRRLTQLPWPGNVRMLENVILRSMLQQEHSGPLDVLAYDDEISSPVSFRQVSKPEEDIGPQFIPQEGLDVAIDKFERQLIINALNSTQGNIARAAQELQIARTTLYYKVKKHQLTLCVDDGRSPLGQM